MLNMAIFGFGLVLLVVSIGWYGNITGECNTAWGKIAQAFSAEKQDNCNTQTMLSIVGMGVGIVVTLVGFTKNK